MLKWALLAGLGMNLQYALHGQMKTYGIVREYENFDTLNFFFEATSGHSYFRYISNNDPLVIKGNPNLDKINPSFDYTIANILATPLLYFRNIEVLV